MPKIQLVRYSDIHKYAEYQTGQIFRYSRICQISNWLDIREYAEYPTGHIFRNSRICPISNWTDIHMSQICHLSKKSDIQIFANNAEYPNG